jgi:hypothetical protein
LTRRMTVSFSKNILHHGGREGGSK